MFHLDTTRNSLTKGNSHSIRTPITKMDSIQLDKYGGNEYLITSSMDLNVTCINENMDFSKSIVLSPYVYLKNSTHYSD